MQKNTSRQPRTNPVETNHKNTYFLHSPWQKCSLLQLKRPFPCFPIAMLFAVTQEMHTWAVRPKQHCTRGGEGGEFVPLGHDGCMAQNWKLHWNFSTGLSRVVACKSLRVILTGQKKISQRELIINLFLSITSFIHSLYLVVIILVKFNFSRSAWNPHEFIRNKTSVIWTTP